MRRAILIVVVGLCAATAAGQKADPSGHLILIGGGEKPAVAMRKFVELAGGPSAPMVVIPTASGEPDIVPYYRELFREEYGCANVEVLGARSVLVLDASEATVTRSPREQGKTFSAHTICASTSCCPGNALTSAAAPCSTPGRPVKSRRQISSSREVEASNGGTTHAPI